MLIRGGKNKDDSREPTATRLRSTLCDVWLSLDARRPRPRRPRRHPVWPDVHLFETGKGATDRGRTDGRTEIVIFALPSLLSPSIHPLPSNTLSSSSSLISYGMLFQLRAALPGCVTVVFKKIFPQHSCVGTRVRFVAAWHLWQRVADGGGGGGCAV